jgi:hypothetical protein
MIRIILSLLAFWLFASPAFAQYDSYGGWTKLQGKKTGFFHTEQIGGRWWLVTPEGNAFYSKGVEAVDLSADKKKPPADKEKAAKDVARQLKFWNFNTVGLWSKKIPGMPWFAHLGFAANFVPNMWLLGIVPDYFSPEFRDSVEKQASKMCPGLVNDPWLIGYFTDNEIRWVPDIRSHDSTLDAMLKKDPQSPGYKKAVAFLKERGHTPQTVSFDDEAEFLGIAAAEYGRIVHDAIRKYDKNHLILGSRFNSLAPMQLTKALAPYYDVFSFNNYDHRAPTYKLREINRLSGKPTMVTEFSFKAMDSGLYNTVGAGDPVLTQQDRADLFTAYVQDLANLPFNVGHGWFKYRDQPKESEGKSPGGWGAENSNYGLVKIGGEPWTLLVTRMTEVNGGIEALAAKAGK